MVRRIEFSIACLDRWLSKAHAIQRCKSGHASSLAVWIASKSPRVGGRKTSRGVMIGIKWRIERLRCNGSGVKAETMRVTISPPLRSGLNLQKRAVVFVCEQVQISI